MDFTLRRLHAAPRCWVQHLGKCTQPSGRKDWRSEATWSHQLPKWSFRPSFRHIKTGVLCHAPRFQLLGVMRPWEKAPGCLTSSLGLRWKEWQKFYTSWGGHRCTHVEVVQIVSNHHFIVPMDSSDILLIKYKKTILSKESVLNKCHVLCNWAFICCVDLIHFRFFSTYQVGTYSVSE